jgi:hypothetical protein
VTCLLALSNILKNLIFKLLKYVKQIISIIFKSHFPFTHSGLFIPNDSGPGVPQPRAFANQEPALSRPAPPPAIWDPLCGRRRTRDLSWEASSFIPKVRASIRDFCCLVPICWAGPTIVGPLLVPPFRTQPSFLSLRFC